MHNYRYKTVYSRHAELSKLKHSVRTEHPNHVPSTFSNEKTTGGADPYNSHEFPALEAVQKTSSWDEVLPETNPNMSSVFLPTGESDSVSHPSSPLAVGDRPHFRYHPVRLNSHSAPKYSEESEDEEEYSDRKADYELRGCISALSNLIGRRIARAMIDLIGIEPEPGPSTQMVLVGARSRADIRSANLRSSIVARIPKKKKNRKIKFPVVSMTSTSSHRQPSGMAGRTGGMVAIGRSRDEVLYHKVLSDPWNNIPVRLGGETMQPSGIATLTLRFQNTVNASGNLSAVIYPNAGVAGNSPNLASASNASPYTYVNAGTFPGAASIAAIATGGRVIAAGVRVLSLSSSTNNQGIVTIGCLPRESTNANGTGGITINGFPFSPGTTTATQGFNEFQNYLSTETYPLKCGASVVYRPQDPLDFTFRAVTTDGFVVPNAADYDLLPFFVVGVTGAAASSALFFELVTHIEYTVSEGTTGVINTGMGTMSQQGVIDSAKSVFNNLVDSTFQGVVGGLSDSLRGAGSYAVRQAFNSLQGGDWGSSTVR